MTDLDDRAARAQQRALEQAGKAMNLRAQAKERQRKEDTRRKCILGGTLIQLMRVDTTLALRVQVALKDHFASAPDDAELFAKVKFFEALLQAAEAAEEERALSGLVEHKGEAPARKPPSPIKPRDVPKSDVTVLSRGTPGVGSESGVAQPSVASGQ